ncbi:hypothetical protein LZG04_03750 [Saccharothrix sp. S26]|uniref:hypothetical protein n=1 Tax=Saccharothrix sp. S26 TaxID=2907215 RepID=UPI001F3E1902|nr:hypothetical protein [Saccharothrix sp. S26]MCE6993929.1 hypothetical protein [Saccharothrix sp. S26]
MNEHELKSALQDVMVASSPPPPMSPEAALDRARRAQRRRQATWGGGLAGLAVVAIAVGAVLVPNLSGGGGAPVAGGQSSRPSVTPTDGPPSKPSSATTGPTTTGPTTTGRPSGTSTSTPWPNGQTDRTATSGPRADKSVAVLNDLISSLPGGLRAQDKTRIGFPDYGPMTRTQSQFADYAGALEVWEYLAYTPVERADVPGVGHLWIQVETKGNSRVGDRPGCGMATSRPYPVEGDGRCDLVDAGGAKVAVVTGDGGANGLEQAAFHRFDDGTLVIVGQSREYRNSGHPAMAELPLTAQQLAAIAADPKFHLD